MWQLLLICFQLLLYYDARVQSSPTVSSLRTNKMLFRKDILLDDLYANNKLEGCPIVTRNVAESIQISAECDEGASLAQFINENDSGKIGSRRSFSSSTGLNLKKLTKGILDEENLNFKLLLITNKGFKFSGSALNTVHFADGNVAISDIKISNLEFQKGETEFSNIKLSMQGVVEINGDQIQIELEKKQDKSIFDVKVLNVQTVTIEELASTFKASVENIKQLKINKKFKIDELKSISLSNPTVVGKLTTDGSMQLVANSEANDENLYFAHENLFVVINKKRGENPKLAIVFNIGKGKSMDDVFSSIVSNPSRDFSFPIVGKISSYDWALSFSEGDDIAVAAPEPMLLPIGINARTEIPKSEFKKICKDSANGINSVSVELRLTSDGRFLFKLTDGLHPNIEKFLECISPDSKNIINLPTELFDNFDGMKINITEFYYNAQTSGFDLKLNVQRDISFFSGILQFSNFKVQIIKDGKSWSVFAKSSTSIQNQFKRSDTDVHDFFIMLEMYKADANNETSIKATVPNLVFTDLLTILGMDRDEFQLSNSFPELMKFGFSEMSFVSEMNRFRVTSIPYLFGLNAKLEAIVWNKADQIPYFQNKKQTSKANENDKNSNEKNVENKKVSSGSNEKTGQSTKENLNNQEKESKYENVNKAEGSKETSQPTQSKMQNQKVRNTKENAEKESKDKKVIVKPKEKNKFPTSETKNPAKKFDAKNNEIHRLFRPSFLNNTSGEKNVTGGDFKMTEESGDYDYIQDSQGSGFFNLEDSLNKAASNKIEIFKTKPEKTKVKSSTPKLKQVSPNEIMGLDIPNIDETSKTDSDDSNIFNDQANDFTGNARSFKKLYSMLNMKRDNKFQSTTKMAGPIRSRANVPPGNMSPLYHESNAFPITTKWFQARPAGMPLYLPTPYGSHLETFYNNPRFLRDNIMLPSKDKKMSMVFSLRIVNAKLMEILEFLYDKPVMSSAWIDDAAIVLIISNTDDEIPEKYETVKKASRSIIGDLVNGVASTKKKFCIDINPSSINKTNNDESKKDASCKDEKNDFDMLFPLDEIRDIKIKKGVTLSCVMSVPDNCKKNELCKWIQKRLPDESKISFSGYLSSNRITLVATLHLVDMFTTIGSIRIDTALLLFTFNENEIESSGLRLKIELSMKQPFIVNLIGFIYEAASGELQIHTKMQKPSYSFLKLDRFWFQDFFSKEALMRASVDTYTDSLTSIELTSYLTLGKPKEDGASDEHLMRFKGVFTLQPAKPSMNYLIGDLNDLSMQTLATAFGYESSLPKFMVNTAFPNGAKFLFTSNPEGINVPSTDFHIKYGYHISGDIRIFEFFIPIEMALLNGALECNVQMIPLDIMNGLIQLRHSDENLNQGPVLKTVISADKSKVEIFGYMHTLGVASTVELLLDNEHLLFNLTGAFFDIFNMDIGFKGKFFGQILKTEFEFFGCLHEKDREDIENSIRSQLTTLGKDTTSIKDKVESSLKVIENGLNDAKKRVTNWKYRIQLYKDQINKKMEDMKKTKSDLKKACDGECGDVCIPFFGWNSQCYKIWGNWVGCPGWDNCKWKVKDVICIASCELDKMGKKILVWGDSIGVPAILGLSEMSTVLQTSGEGYAKNYKQLYDHAKITHESIIKTIKPTFQIQHAMEVSHGTSSVQLKNICATGFLNKDWKSSSFFDVEGNLLGESVKWREEISNDLKLRDLITKKTIAKRFPEIYQDSIAFDSDFKGMLLQIKEQQTGLEILKNNLQNRIDEVLAGRSYIKKINDDKGTRAFVSPKEENYYRAIFDEPITYDHMNSDSMRALHTSSPWNLVDDFDYEMNNVPLNVGKSEESFELSGSDEVAETRSLDTCIQMKHVVEKYDKLTQGMKQFAASTEYQRQMYLTTKKSYLADLQKMRKRINGIGSVDCTSKS